MTNLYKILGVADFADSTEIKIAYYKLAKKFHPDVNDGDTFFENKFKEIQEAYENLTNTVSKGHHDSWLKKTFYNIDDEEAAVKSGNTYKSYHDQKNSDRQKSGKSYESDQTSTTDTVNQQNTEEKIKNKVVYEFNTWKFYPSYMEILPGKIVYYDSFYRLYFRSSQSTYGWSTSRGINFSVMVPNLKTDGVKIIDIYCDGNMKRKDHETWMNIYKLIARNTFIERLNIYIGVLESKGCFDVNQKYLFYANGDIKKNNQLLANLKSELDSGTVGLGVSWKGMNNSQTNPQDFYILNGVPNIKIFGFATGFKLKIEIVQDFDVFFFLLDFYSEHGHYPKEQYS